MGFYGYQGWGDTEAVANYQATGGSGKGGPSSTTGTSSNTGTSGTGIPGGTGFLNAPAINLPDLYQGLFDKSGITDIEKELSTKSRTYTDAVARIKDNPYLSEATMSGRLKKIDEKFNADTKVIRDEIAMKKADIETQLNLKLKQFDINNTQTQQAISQFNSLLQSGALDSASGEDIGNITRATGISSSMIQAAIKANKAKNVQTSAINFDDGTNQGFAIINSKTGEIISKQIIAASKPSSTGGGGTPGSSQYLSTAISSMSQKITSKLNSYNHISPADWNTALAAWLAAGLSKDDFVKNFGQYADIKRGDFQTAYGFANPEKALTLEQQISSMK